MKHSIGQSSHMTSSTTQFWCLGSYQKGKIQKLEPGGNSFPQTDYQTPFPIYISEKIFSAFDSMELM